MSLEKQLNAIESRVDELIALCDGYKRDNNTLRSRENELNEERSNLLRKNDMAHTKVESMISRLKSLEQES